MAVQNYARTLVPISRELLDVAEIATVEGGGAARSTPNHQPSIPAFDVVVAGGGTGGGPAALAAARSGAKTLVVEFQHVLGGVATEGRIGGYGGYYDGNVTGFTTELDRGAKAIGKGGIYFFAESEFLRRGIVEAGGEVWLWSMVSGAEVKEEKVAVAFLKYSTWVLSSSALYIAFRLGIFSSMASLGSRRSSFTSSPAIRTHWPFWKAQISAFGFAASCLETFLTFPV